MFLPVNAPPPRDGIDEEDFITPERNVKWRAEKN